MVYERALESPCSNWNIAGNKFIYTLTPNSSEIFLVKLFLDKEPVVFKFKLPEHLTRGLINCYFDPVLDNFVVPPENPRRMDPDQSVDHAFSLRNQG